MKKLFETEKLEMEKREIGLQADLDRLKGKLLAVRGTVDKEKAALDEKKSALEIEQAKNVKEDYERKISKLNKKNKIRFAAVEKDYRKLESELKKSNRALRKRERTLAKAEKRIAGLRLANDEYRSKYIDAEKKNKALAREARNLPRKFSEMARLNKQLIKETAKMHYNLGVFYTNSKEYKRAITEFVKATEINPKDAHTHFNLGYIYGEYLADRNKAMRHFRHYLRYAERNDKDIDWVKKYLLTWETFEGTKTGAIR